MATDDDNFDIDIYGDGTYSANDAGAQEDSELVLDAPENLPGSNNASANQTAVQGNSTQQESSSRPQASSVQPTPAAQPAQQANAPPPAPQQQTPNTTLPAAPHGTKRKEYDDRPTDPNATTAVMVSELAWWETEDNVRQWVDDCGVQKDEFKEVTFSEHKVNGKSKGQAFVEFTSPQAATAFKHQIDSQASPTCKHSAIYTSPHPNPFKTLPKDAPMRRDGGRGGGGGYGGGGGGGGYGGMNNQSGGGFRGGRGGYNNRGMGGNMNNYNNRGGGGFNPMGGFQGAPTGMMGNFPAGPMGGMPNYGFNNNRGGNMMGGGMRGGPGGMRGGRGGNMGGPNMMGMGMGPMAMNPMAMNPMMGNMGMQGQQPFQGGPAQPFNQGQNQGQNLGQGGFPNPSQGGGSGDGSWNPHGAKRSRQD